VGQPIMAAAAFQAAALPGERSLGFATTTSISVVERGAASKGGCSHDWLPHVAVTPKITKTDKRPARQKGCHLRRDKFRPDQSNEQ